MIPLEKTLLPRKPLHLTPLAKVALEGKSMMKNFLRQRISIGLVAACIFACLGTVKVPAQQLDSAAVIQQVDAAVKARVESIAGYTVTEHYAVYRNQDEINPVAEMTVKTTYQRDTGKSYTIISQTGSEIIRSLVLSAILDNEKRINLPANREGTWITSANYEMKLKPGGTQILDGRDCLVLELTPRRKTPYLIEGTLWVDSKDGSIVQVQGTAPKSSSVFTGPTQMIRQYANIGGFPQATHARAVSNSFMFGETVVKIDYQDYQVQLSP
jgi:outer membrane lipoprotein-sorting protein